jgi:hypothetical protein
MGCNDMLVLKIISVKRFLAQLSTTQQQTK